MLGVIREDGHDFRQVLLHHHLVEAALLGVLAEQRDVLRDCVSEGLDLVVHRADDVLLLELDVALRGVEGLLEVADLLVQAVSGLGELTLDDRLKGVDLRLKPMTKGIELRLASTDAGVNLRTEGRLVLLRLTDEVGVLGVEGLKTLLH